MRNYLYGLATDKYRGFGPGLLKGFLLLLSLIYGLGVRILAFFNRLKPRKLNCKVISVGNITLGGTGKTSLVEYIARYLKQQGHKVAILSRGYKRKFRSNELGVMSYETMGDEPYMLWKNLDVPVIVDANRIRAANLAQRKYGADTVILDDGFQQWRIKKDLEIVTLDVTQAFGNYHLIPRGILREPLSALRRADICIFTKTNLNPDFQDLKDFLKQLNPGVTIFESMHSPVGFYRLDQPAELLKPEVFKGKTVALISGIADPDSFEKLIISLGINVGLSYAFPDHHNYSQKDLEAVRKGAQKKNIDTFITTEKDATRILYSRLQTPNSQLLVLRIALKITKDEQGFHNRLLKLYSL
jgi:tetraacyldisaccharide 4'-kinase